jgi:hypothetical protein
MLHALKSRPFGEPDAGRGRRTRHYIRDAIQGNVGAWRGIWTRGVRPPPPHGSNLLTGIFIVVPLGRCWYRPRLKNEIPK